jgi:hypothetical protein
MSTLYELSRIDIALATTQGAVTLVASQDFDAAPGFVHSPHQAEPR